jgi:hypothetical protein
LMHQMSAGDYKPVDEEGKIVHEGSGKEWNFNTALKNAAKNGPATLTGTSEEPIPLKDNTPVALPLTTSATMGPRIFWNSPEAEYPVTQNPFPGPISAPSEPPDLINQKRWVWDRNQNKIVPVR